MSDTGWGAPGDPPPSQLTISSGGAVGVDPESLRAAADALVQVARQVAEAGAELDRARDLLMPALFDAIGPHGTLATESAGLAEAVAEAGTLTGELRTAAAAYDLVELQVQRDAAFARGGHTVIASLDAEIARLRREYPEAADIARDAVADHAASGSEVFSQLLRTAMLFPFLSGAVGLAAGALAGLAASGRGRVASDHSLHAAATPVALRPRKPVGGISTTAPQGLAGAFSRIPQGTGDTRIRVERYDMPGGSRAFAVYITGTRELAGSRDPFDMAANERLYLGKDTASATAARAALEAAGARPGDELYAFGHSQGGMIAGSLATDGTYDVQVLATAGSPTSTDPGPDALSAQIRHTDDPVSVLADGGHRERIGAPGSFVAERCVDPAPGLQDLSLPAHHMSAYIATAEQVDTSGDPRAAALADRLATLERAERVSVYEFAAEAPAAPVPHPTPAPAPTAPDPFAVPAPSEPFGATVERSRALSPSSSGAG